MTERWPVESIPDGDSLYLRIHKDCIRPNKTIQMRAYAAHSENGQELSTDWSKYATAAYTRRGSPRRPPEYYGVVSMNVANVRMLEALTVVHHPSPETNNRSHSLICGPNDEQARLHLARYSDWAILQTDPVEQVVN